MQLHLFVELFYTHKVLFLQLVLIPALLESIENNDFDYVGNFYRFSHFSKLLPSDNCYSYFNDKRQNAVTIKKLTLHGETGAFIPIIEIDEKIYFELQDIKELAYDNSAGWENQKLSQILETIYPQVQILR